TVLLAMLGESSDITSRETLTPVFHEPESFDFFSSELPDIGSSDLFNPQERHINPKSIDLDIANALSILENMSDCEAEDIEQTAPSPSSVAEESWGEPTQQSPVYDSDDDDDDDMAREALSKMLAIYS
ncbi:1809_t:CDS:2, partial [Scutellospora calospora]